MKKTVLFIIALIAGFLYVSAQSDIYPKLPTIKKIEPGQDWWEPDTVYSFSSMFVCRNILEYNSHGLLEVSIEQGQLIDQWQEQSSWENNFLYTYTYDSNNNLLTVLYQYWRNNSWINSELYTYTYDSNNNLLTELKQFWENNSWDDSYACTYYTYDSNNNLLTKVTKLWGDNLSNYFDSCTYTYDANNNKLTDIRQIWDWDNRLLVNDSKYIWTYDSNNNVLTDFRQIWENDSWVNSSQFIYTYDSNNNKQTEIQQIWENNSWVITRQYTYSYDSNNNLLSNGFSTCTYDSNNNLLTIEASSSLRTYTYDTNNNLLTDLRQVWRDNSWTNTTQYIMTYDENSNGTSVEWLVWKNGSWQLSDISDVLSYPTLQLCYNNMQSVFIWRNCDKMTASYKKVSDITGKEKVKTPPPIQIYSSGKTIHINNQTGKNAVVSVYRIDGVKVAEQTMTSQTAAMKMPVSGFYFVSVKTGNEEPVTAKLIVR